VSRLSQSFSITALLLLVVFMTACSSSTAKPTTSPTTGSASAGSSTPGSSTATGAPIQVGLICSCSGSPFGAATVPGEEVFKAWVNTVNGSGGINGHPVKLITKDDTSLPGSSLTDAQELISDHVDAIVDVTINDNVWASAVQAANIPVIGLNATDEPFFTNPDFYPMGETGDSAVVAYILTIKSAGGSNFGDMYCVESASCSQYEQSLKTTGKQLGVPLTYVTSISATAPNYTAQCLAAKNANVKYLIVEDASAIIARVAKDCDIQGYDPVYVIGEGSFGTLWQTTPGLKKDTLSYDPNLPYWVNTPANQAMNAAINKYYPGLENNGAIWSGTSPLAWPSGLLLEDAVKAGGLGPNDTPSAAEVVKGLESLKGDTLQGMSPPLTFAAGKPHPVDCWFTSAVVNGQNQLLNNGKLTCSPGPSS
jgi:branched-chain amino acid transport system substrate-binding protein